MSEGIRTFMIIYKPLLVSAFFLLTACGGGGGSSSSSTPTPTPTGPSAAQNATAGTSVVVAVGM